jgi:cell division transport system permease protein
MKGKDKNIIARRLIHSYLSSIISISLVLLLVGVFGILAVNARAVSKYFKENIKITTVLKDNVSDNEGKRFCGEISRLPFVHAAEFISKEKGTEEMKNLLGDDFLEVFDSNPIPVSVDIRLNENYFAPDSLKKVKEILMETSKVEDVVYEDSLIKLVNGNMERIGMVLVIFIVLLMFISFVLINNTVRLNVYTKRFSIYTMRLVGATKAFIRAPFVIKAVFQGLIAGLLAATALLLILFVVKNEFVQMFSMMDIRLLVAVMCGVIMLGIFICVICTYFVVNKMISLNNSDLYY